jgi:ribonucleotide monophosphatase NagD (HAD superfamily)
LTHQRVLCIGDGVATDVKGANAQGLDVLFIARGIHGGEAIGPDGIIPSAVDALLAKQGAKAEWARADLAW